MKLSKYVLQVTACCLLAVSAAHAATATAVGDFSLLDQNGKFHQLSWYGDQKALVLYVQDNTCPTVPGDVATLKAMREKYESQGVTFMMLNAQPGQDRASLANTASEPGYDLPILMDEAQLVAESLGIGSAAEALVIDPGSMTLLYQGPVSDHSEGAQSPLDAALAAALTGQATAHSATAPACPIEFAARDQHRANGVSYSRDIAPLLIEKCVGCHHDGGIGPWSMTDHTMVRGWSKMIREVVMTRRMPPGQIDPHVGKPIVDVVEMTPQELQLLVHWVDAGAPIEEGAEDPLTKLTHDNPKYSLGEPDMTFTVAAQTIPATGIVDYRYVPVELNLDRDVWVRAIEFVPGDRQVLHHVIAYLSSPADKSVRGRDDGSARDESIGGFAPGRQPEVFRDNSGRLIRKGSNLLLQMHYTTSGKPTVDETEIGLYLYDEPPAYVMAGGVAGQRRFMIPPQAKEHKLEGEMLVERDAYLYGMTPHMHFRGKYMSYTAVYPDGRSEVLLSVPKYEFNWQFNYQLEEPLFLPAGTRLVAKGAMDNSDRNRFNPDPTRPVLFGLQTKHEMFFGFLTLRYVGDTPQSLAGGAREEEKEIAGR